MQPPPQGISNLVGVRNYVSDEESHCHTLGKVPGRESTGPVSGHSGKTGLYMAETQGETAIKEQFPNEVKSVHEIDIWKHNSRSRHTPKSVSNFS